MDDSNKKTKKVSFNILKQKIGSGGESGSIMPAVVGSIIPYMGTDLPEGYLMCDGSDVDKTIYSELYAVIGDIFGIASDDSKFKLPKIDDARYLQGNDTPGTNVEAGLPNHTHTYWKANSMNATCQGGHSGSINQGGENSYTGGVSETDGIYGKSDTVTPKSITVRYLICYKKIIGKVDAIIGMPDYKATPVQEFKYV